MQRPILAQILIIYWRYNRKRGAENIVQGFHSEACSAEIIAADKIKSKNWGLL